MNLLSQPGAHGAPSLTMYWIACICYPSHDKAGGVREVWKWAINSWMLTMHTLSWSPFQANIEGLSIMPCHAWCTTGVGWEPLPVCSQEAWRTSYISHRFPLRTRETQSVKARMKMETAVLYVISLTVTHHTIHLLLAPLFLTAMEVMHAVEHTLWGDSTDLPGPVQWGHTAHSTPHGCL